MAKNDRIKNTADNIEKTKRGTRKKVGGAERR